MKSSSVVEIKSKRPRASVRLPPSAPDPAAMDAFARAAPPGRGVITRSDGRNLRKLQIYVPAELAKALKLRCVEDECAISDFVARILAEKLR